MLWEPTACALLGLVIAAVAVSRHPARFLDTRLALATGAGGAMLGGLITRAVLGPGSLPVVLIAGAVFGAVLLSLVVRVNGGQVRSPVSA
ncbi:hypothetical protein [Streptomyces spiramenti]|uniref:GlsB/YeaQ/YmgE family stress response membrane protein n=1 Tax=Streptomyces spiramenti TaxID=2720606 RepID=A0ABX1AVJ6_9ACTN|nr:hypothetical protein [Streptomyces spiramenti]NJP69045.1 hypothetical protein [Streptomyces spiramenti]